MTYIAITNTAPRLKRTDLYDLYREIITAVPKPCLRKTDLYDLYRVIYPAVTRPC